MIFWREVDAAIQFQHKEQHISKWNYEIIVLQEIHISRIELQSWSLELVITFLKYIFWNLGLRFSSFLLGSCNANLINTDEFSVCIFPTMES